MINPIKVFVRIKPAPESTCLSVDRRTITLPNPRNSHERISFSFDHVFNQESTQVDLWDKCKATIKLATTGINATIFCYGQTGSGKSFTMQKDGIIQNAIAELLQSKSTITASFIEVYNEKILDLLSESSEHHVSKSLDLRQSGKSIMIFGLIATKITSMQDFKKQHGIALRRRATGATNLNQESSRSHFILQLNCITEQDGKTVSSKISLVDLAGSEDNKRTGNAGLRLNESCSINGSLFALGQVIKALNGSFKVPYRDSKLTRILQDSLGGNSATILIACCSPLESDLIDTNSTLVFATQSSLIKNVVSVNVLVEKPTGELTARIKALEDWKRNRLKPQRNSSELNSFEPKRDLRSPSPTLVEIENQMNRTVEERVNARMKELTQSMLSKSVSEKFAEVQKRLDSKLSKTTKLEGKENTPVSTNSKRAVQETTPDQPSQINDLKTVTNINILHILNRGSLKSIMELNTIGKKRAQAILDTRSEQGEFDSLDDLERAGFKLSQICSLFKANLDI